MPQRAIHYADATIDRAAQRRDDRAWIDERLRAATTRFVAVADGRHPIAGGGIRRPYFLGAGDLGDPPPEEPILLGVQGDAAYFAIDVTDAPPPFPAGVTLQTIRGVVADLGQADGAMLACAGALVHWHRTHRFCGACGRPTAPARAGHVRLCAGAACRRQHFPRTDPAVIWTYPDLVDS